MFDSSDEMSAVFGRAVYAPCRRCRAGRSWTENRFVERDITKMLTSLHHKMYTTCLTPILNIYN